MLAEGCTDFIYNKYIPLLQLVQAVLQSQNPYGLLCLALRVEDCRFHMQQVST